MAQLPKNIDKNATISSMNQKQSMYLPPKNILSDGSPQIAEVNNLQLICDKDAGLGEKVKL